MDVQRYMQEKYGPKPETVDLTEEEFVAALVAAGSDERDAKLQAKLAAGLGSEVRVGARSLRIKKE